MWTRILSHFRRRLGYVASGVFLASLASWQLLSLSIRYGGVPFLWCAVLTLAYLLIAQYTLASPPEASAVDIRTFDLPVILAAWIVFLLSITAGIVGAFALERLEVSKSAVPLLMIYLFALSILVVKVGTSAWRSKRGV